MVASYAPLGSKKKTSLVVAYPIGREISKSRHLLLHLTPRDYNFSKILFFHLFHLYLPDGAVGVFFLKYAKFGHKKSFLKSAKFGHKITLKSPPFDFQLVTETS